MKKNDALFAVLFRGNIFHRWSERQRNEEKCQHYGSCRHMV